VRSPHVVAGDGVLVLRRVLLAEAEEGVAVVLGLLGQLIRVLIFVLD
jgi:hypothetical protein